MRRRRDIRRSGCAIYNEDEQTKKSGWTYVGSKARRTWGLSIDQMEKHTTDESTSTLGHRVSAIAYGVATLHHAHVSCGCAGVLVHTREQRFYMPSPYTL
uniref:Uncharacterized protein n=1 Tax=Peronospora matthiolae TaxID=2874970 RepID=A0AAV1USF9_9STRA